MLKDAPPRELGILFERNPVPMLVVDTGTLRIVEVNPAAAGHYGYSRDEFLAMSVDQIRPAEDVPLFQQAFARMLPGVVPRGEFRHCRRDGSVMDVEVSTEDLEFGGRPSRLVVMVDVTERNRTAHRLERLQAVTAALAQAWTSSQVADAVIGRGVEALGARSGSLALVAPDGGELHLAGSIGYAPELQKKYSRIPLGTPFPLSDAVREGAPIFLANAEERAARYPHLGDVRQQNGPGAMAAVPLLHDGRAVGVMGLNFPHSYVLGPDERAFILTLAEQCSQALARVQAHEAAEMQRRRLAAVLEAIPTGVWIADAAGAITLVNEAASAIFGAAPMSRGIGEYEAYRGWWPDTGRPVQPHEWALARAVTTGEVTVGELLEIERADGSHGFILNSAAPIRDGAGELVGGVVTALDVTPRIRAERERDEALAQAEAARQAAEDANRAKSDFLASMSHELRTPLNAIGGYVELMQLGLRGPVTEAQQQDLERIQRSQRHLLSLVNHVLNFARLEAGAVQFHLADVPVAALLDELDDYVTPQVRARRLAYTHEGCPPELAARADEEKLKQVLLNLLTNAIKYTGPGGRIQVRCRAEGGRVRMDVSDTGAGIPADKLPFIFDPFVQAGRALHRPAEGVGLGLAISRDLARAMDGDLTVRSAEGEGSTFTLTLPAAQGNQGRQP